MLDGALAKVMLGLAASGFMALGSLSWNNHTTDQTQEVRLRQLESAMHSITELNDKLALTNQNIAILNVKLAVLEEDLDDLEDESK